MRRWLVCTPTFSYTEIIDPEIGGPTYDVADTMLIEAESRRDAIALAVKAWLSGEERGQFCRDQRDEGLCPYSGIWAEEVCLACSDPHADGPCAEHQQAEATL